MPDRRQKLIKTARIIFIILTAGVVLLALESLWTKLALFRNYALGLAGFGLLIVSLIVSRIVNEH